jgi:hypothetical protein
MFKVLTYLPHGDLVKNESSFSRSEAEVCTLLSEKKRCPYVVCQ